MCGGCLSLTRLSPFSTSSTVSYPFSFLSSSSSTLSCFQNFSTRRTWKTCVTPRRTRVRTLTTSSTPRQFGKACEVLLWNHCISTLYRSKTNGIAERAVRRVKERTSAVLLRSRLDERWWSNFMECSYYLQDLLTKEKTQYEKRYEEAFKVPIISFGAMIECHPFSQQDQMRIHQFGKKVLLGIFLGCELIAGKI